MSSEILDAYWAAPPMARTLATAIFVTSVSVYTGLLPVSWIYFSEDRLLRLPPEIWRLATAFLLSTPKIGIVLDPYFAYQSLKQLETANVKFPRKEDLLWYLVTVGGFIICLLSQLSRFLETRKITPLLNRVFLGGYFFLHGLIIAIAYTANQDLRGVKSTYFFFTVPAQAVPYCMLLGSLLMSPSLVPLQITGIIAAHLHDFLSRLWPEFGGGRNLLATPSFVSYLVQTPRVLQRDYGTAIRPPGAQPSGSTVHLELPKQKPAYHHEAIGDPNPKVSNT
ncbi:hypothetical protein N657DRAFT_631648 [Parathielavia appendiculata]|uniref:Derlin n=1 Tax=Parathielavia appendiculata TaxID=2587402 RepID=A0AAN6U7K7_9PEZI|nr:hypothetical protein N657DRAFT_631648 [Parathielavia appendiculata]